MCAVFGYLDYKGKVSNAILKKLIQNLSIAAEVRGTDATGISYVNHGKVMTFKKAKPAHKAVFSKKHKSSHWTHQNDDTGQ